MSLRTFFQEFCIDHRELLHVFWAGCPLMLLLDLHFTGMPGLWVAVWIMGCGSIIAWFLTEHIFDWAIGLFIR